MNYGSVCSGIEAASIAWEPLGWRAQDDEFYAKLLTDYLERFSQADRAEINKLLMAKLSDALTDKQKSIKISSLLTKLRRQKVIVNTGSDTAPCWQLAKRI